ncbi:hypothetical protein AB0A69_31430 [Streptomyces sp. NPDC045431]|uniref:hypothetical protein n=1 Tax=Streptomyces sp. NPDC045431 TaxID=3155613 RepID=UPI003402E73F
MKGLASRRGKVSIGALALAAMAMATVYIFGLPPFERRGEIKASDVCETLGNSSSATRALGATLPDEPEYSFRDTWNGTPVSIGGNYFTIHCHIYGGGRVLFHTRAQLTDHKPSDDWVKKALHDKSPKAEKFSAGAMGAIRGGRAAILVPCSSSARLPGGTPRFSYSLSVEVELHYYDRPASQKVRQGLTDLALGAAQYAHKRNGCNLPSNLPAKAPKVGPGA